MVTIYNQPKEEEVMKLLIAVNFIMWFLVFGYFGYLLWEKLDRIIELLERKE